MHPKTFAKHLHHDNVVAAIRDAEHKTSGEIRVSISPKHIDDPVAAAQVEFLRLGMNKSPERNGVLIFVAPRTHKFAVVGDEAVHAKCGDEFWRQLADAMTGYFRTSEFTPGIIHGVQRPANCWRNISRAGAADRLSGLSPPAMQISQRFCLAIASFAG